MSVMLTARRPQSVCYRLDNLAQFRDLKEQEMGPYDRLSDGRSAAGAHAIGNSNMTKAETLVDHLRMVVLPPLLNN
jgi:hypothetical protein